MSRSKWLGVGQWLIAGLSLVWFVSPAFGQGIQTALEPRGRILPSVGPGVTALKQDAAGRFYVLAKPANVISIYGPDGKLVNQLPNAQSKGATIHYAVDFDISPEGKVVVVDRGANAVEIFAPDGSLVARVPVNAPTSVVALSDGQFAVTSLTSKRLVQVLDEQGNYVRSFGDPTEVPHGTDKKSLADLGRISGDTAGHIFFAFTTVADPTLREYDRYGYVAYEATVPEEAFEELQNAPADRVEVGLNVGRYSLYDQTQGWISLGSSGDLKYGGGLGTGLLSEFNRGGGFGGFGRGGMGTREQQGNMQSGTGTFPGGLGGGPLAGVFSGQVSSNGSSIQLGMGSMSGGGGRGRGGAGAGAAANGNDQSLPSGFSLSFFGGGNHSGGYVNDPDFDAAFNPSAQDLSAPTDPQSTLFGDVGFGTSIQPSYTSGPPPGIGQTAGISGAFILGSTFNSFAYRGRDGGGFGGPPPGAGAGGTPSVAGTKPGSTSPEGPKGDEGFVGGTGMHGPEMEGRYGHGRFGGGETSVGASVRVNLGDLGGNAADKPIITAIAVDPTTQEVWAGIGDSLVHFSKTGEPMEMFSLTLKGGTHLKATAILIEPNRFLIATDPWGVFEFSPPDGPAVPASAQVKAAPAGAPAPQ